MFGHLPENSAHSQALLGRSLCKHAFCKLLGMGNGRFQKLKRAFRTGRATTDGRFIKKHRERVSENRIIVHEYLEELYQTVSEPMPETSEKGMVRQIAFRKRRGKKPRIASRQSKMTKDEKAKHEMRYLPPGTFSDYLQLLQARHPDKKISLKLFSSEPWMNTV